MMVHLILSACLLCFSLVVQAAHNDVLIIVNDNSINSPQVGEYYAQRRDVPAQNIVHVRTTTDYYMKWNQFEILRDQIIKHIQTYLLDTGQYPISCTGSASPYYCQESVDQIKNHSSIKYIVTTKGLPTRLFVGDATSQPSSVDSFLRYWLTNYFETPGLNVGANQTRAKAFADGRSMRIIDPALDSELVIGRIDGVDLASAKLLVDKAINAEHNGIFGKLYGSQYGNTGGIAKWWDYSKAKNIYGVSGSDTTPDVTAWRYQHGLFGDLFTNDGNGVRYTNSLECLNHIESSSTASTGKSPQDCVVKLTDGGDAPPARSSSRQPLVDNSLVYLGSLDGQPTTGSFTDFLNWRHNDQCTVTLCENAADPAACRATSTDPFKDINTDCVGVADGFIGYNFQSYPVAFMSVWPTAWYQSEAAATDQWGHMGGGDVSNLSLPRVRDDIGSDDSYSLWHLNSPDRLDEACFVDSASLGISPSNTCRHDAKIVMVNKAQFDPVALNLNSPQIYEVSFKYKAANVKASTKLNIQLFVNEQTFNDGSVIIVSNNQINYGVKTAVSISAGTTPAGANDWASASVQFTLDPALHLHPQKIYKGIKIRLLSSTKFEGDIGVDEIVVKEVGTTSNLIANGSFNEGHKSVSAGDHAANFLSRLNGVGFWGSTSHYGTGGHSFDQHPMDTLIYFMRGLPLGDAVWFAESRPSGLFYGDPLYSPIAIHLNYFAPYPQDYIDFNGIDIYADTVNGQGADVSTSYSVEYCSGTDFYNCDLANSWQSTGVTGTGGQRNQLLGHWVPDMSRGEYVLRLSVTSQNATKSTSQTFYDYYNIKLFDASADYDSDGLSNHEELNNNTDMDVADTDGDGLSDYVEITVYLTNPLTMDSDGDQLNDGVEVNQYSTDPNNADTDGDGYYDGAEIAVGMDPLIADNAYKPWAGKVTGRITSADGKGLAGVAIWDALKYPVQTVTDENGYYVLSGYLGSETVLLLPQSYQSGYSIQSAGWNGQNFIHDGGAIVARDYIATPNDGTVRGHVALENGEPISDITFWDVFKYPQTVTTNADGEFLSQTYASGDGIWFNVFATNSGYTLAPLDWDNQFSQHDGSAMAGFDYVATQNPGTISGRITTPDGKPVSGITFWDVTRYPTTVTTGADGRFIIQNYQAGDYVWLNMNGTGSDYTFVPSGWNGASFQHDGSAVKQLNFVAVPQTIQWTGKITGRITSADGKGLAGVAIWDALKYPVQTVTDENGYYELSGYLGSETVLLLPQSYQSGYSIQSAGWNGQNFIHDGGAIVARDYIATPNTDTVRGRVMLENGEPLAGITFWDVFKYPETVTTNADGVFLSQSYAPGDNIWFNSFSTNSGYTLSVSGWDGQFTQHDGSAMTGFDYVATQNPGTVSGRITTPDGKPLAGITFWDVFNYPETVTTNADGRFIIQNYKVGDYVWLNLFGTGTDYSFVPSGWDGQIFQHDGTATKSLNFIATP